MSDFALSASGPEVLCDFPACILNAFHPGDHEFAKAKPELSLRRYVCVICSATFRVYGEHYRANARTCDNPACLLELARREGFQPTLQCRCPQRPYPHELVIHPELRRESFNPEKRFCWPWSLAQSERVEPSTERMAA